LSQLRGNLPAVLLILFVGYVLTVVRMRSNSLIPSVIMHTAYNAMIFGIAALSTLVESGTKTVS
jgi:membrane protease YdiL (CAAX protease family)